MIYVNNKKITFAFLERKLEPPTTDQNYLYFQAADNIGFVSMSCPTIWQAVFEISTDGETWTTWTKTTSLNGIDSFETIVLPHFGAYVFIRIASFTGPYNAGPTLHISFNFDPPYQMESTPKISAGGNIMSLQDLSPNAYPKSWYFYGAFAGCTSLITPPELPSSDLTLSTAVYSDLFHGCTSLLYAPELPATTLTISCYSNMFRNCTSLQTAPELPATTLGNVCYLNMFYNCTSLQTAPELPATNLAPNCYSGMFSNCTSLQTAPELPATTMETWCYSNMFAKCTSLQTAPELPSTNLAASCYRNMFSNCESLQTAPELPATTLVDSCYSGMFAECTLLSYIKVGATSWPSDTSPETAPTYDWVRNVYPNGTFYKKNITIPVGNYGIPDGWEVINY